MIRPPRRFPLFPCTAHILSIAADAHYHILDVKVDGVAEGAVASYNFTDVPANHTIEATFELTTHTIAASAGAHGSITPAGSVAVNDGDAQSFTIAADAHYHILDVKVDGVSVGAVASYSFTDVAADHTIEVAFALTTHTIAASAGAHGSITPSGNVSVNDGDTQSFTIAADAHYHILDVKGEGVSVGAVASYKFNDVGADHTIEGAFANTQHTIAASGGGPRSRSP